MPIPIKDFAKLADNPTIKFFAILKPPKATPRLNILLINPLSPDNASVALLIPLIKPVNKSMTPLIIVELAKFIVNSFHAFLSLLIFDSKLSVVFSN